MNVFLYSANPTAEQMECVRSKRGALSASSTRIMIDCSRRDNDSARLLLLETGYPLVRVYSTSDEHARDKGGWESSRVVTTSRRRRASLAGRFAFGREEIGAIANDADSGLVLWNGSDLDAFTAIICMVAFGKSVDVIHSDGKAEQVRSFADLRNMLPERNPQHRPWDKNIPLRDQWKVAERFIPSKSIAERLAMAPFRKREIIDVILGSPTSLDEKLDALAALSQYDDLLYEILDEVEERLNDAKGNETSEDKLRDIALGWGFAAYGSFSTHRDAVGEALGSLSSSGPGEIIYRKSFWDERPELFEEHEAGIAPFSSIEAALEDLRFEMVRDEWDDDAPFWSVFEKWKLASDGTWENPFTYYAIKDEIVFFNRNVYDEENRFWTGEDGIYGGSIAPDLNIRVPFGVGDIITLDCRPFAPLHYALVIEAEREGRADCCMPRLLHLDDYESKRMGKPMWTGAGPKHASSLDLCLPGYSPLYRMELHEGPLPEKEQLIEEVQDWLRGDAEKGGQLSEALMFEMSSEEILAFISEQRRE